MCRRADNTHFHTTVSAPSLLAAVRSVRRHNQRPVFARTLADAQTPAGALRWMPPYRKPPGACQDCGYTLIGLKPDETDEPDPEPWTTCPECGLAVAGRFAEGAPSTLPGRREPAPGQRAAHAAFMWLMVVFGSGLLSTAAASGMNWFWAVSTWVFVTSAATGAFVVPVLALVAIAQSRGRWGWTPLTIYVLLVIFAVALL